MTISCLVATPKPAAPAAEAPTVRVDEVQWSVTGEADGEAARALLVMDAALHGTPSLVTDGPSGRAPSLQGVPATSRHLSLEATDEGLEAALCVSDGPCELAWFTGTPEAIGLQTAQWVAEQLALEVPSEVASCLGELPDDDYLHTIVGRAAAAHYGLSEPSAHPGDVRRDPIARAVVLDARVPTTQWMLARHLAPLDAAGAARHATYAAAACDAHAGWQADAAALAGPAGNRAASWPEGDRFVLGALDDALARGVDAHALAQRATRLWPSEASVARRHADATHGADHRAALQRWSVLDPTDPAPELALATVALAEGRWESAVAHASAAEARGATEPARELATPALLALGRLDEAQAGAPDRLAARISARRGDPVDATLGPEGLLLAAARALPTDPSDALAFADQALTERPDWPEALALAATAAERSGHDAAPFRDRLALVEP